MNELTEIEKAYMAGFFDGEGCVLIQKKKNKGESYSYGLHVRITQKDTVLLQEMKQRFGGAINVLHDEVYMWNSSGERAAQFIATILPYSRMKRPQLELGLQFRECQRKNDLRFSRHTNPEFADMIQASRDEMYTRMRSLKRETLKLVV